MHASDAEETWRESDMQSERKVTSHEAKQRVI